MHDLIISAPFGNYYDWMGFEGVTYTLGSFTFTERGADAEPHGSRWWRVLMTVRYSFALQSWRNKIGLKNPGIDWLIERATLNTDLIDNAKPIDLSDKVVSIFGFADDEWVGLFEACKHINPLALELNISCPNVFKPIFNPKIFVRAKELLPHCQVIVKLPPLNYDWLVKAALDAGLSHFHACNTMPSPLGGLSGKALFCPALSATRWVRTYAPHCTIIGGGGVVTGDDAKQFVEAGANRVAIGSMLFWPPNWLRINSIKRAIARAKETMCASSN